MATEKIPHRTASEMFPLIEVLLASGQSQKEFCLEHNLPIAVMQYWKRKFQSQSTEAFVEGFVPINLQELPTAGTGIEIIYCDGTKLCLGSDAKVEQIRQLLPVFLQR